MTGWMIGEYNCIRCGAGWAGAETESGLCDECEREGVCQNIFVTVWGDVEVSAAELRASGVSVKVHPRWNSVSGWDGTGVTSMRPKINADLLLDFLTLFARDQYLQE